MKYSKLMSVRMEEDFRRKIKAEAALRGMSMAELIREAVEEWLENHPIEKEKEWEYGNGFKSFEKARRK